MGAVENLAATLDRFEELARLSDRLVAKFERTEGNPEKNGEVKGKQDTQPDIIDLFNEMDRRFNIMLGRIGSNVERVVNMID